MKRSLCVLVLLTSLVLSAVCQTKPLLVVAGKPYAGDINSINPYDAESITILKDQAAINKYGEQGRDGVIEFEMKPGKNTAYVSNGRIIPALKPYTSCVKKVYGPNWFVGYPTCDAAENGAHDWLQGKTSIILESVDTFQWGSGPDWEDWGYEIHYITGGACYK